jgi:hypothetical protein
MNLKYIVVFLVYLFQASLVDSKQIQEARKQRKKKRNKKEREEKKIII